MLRRYENIRERRHEKVRHCERSEAIQSSKSERGASIPWIATAAKATSR